jgi:predicted transcriptional regulator
MDIDHQTVRRVAIKRIDSLKETLVYSVDKVEQLHYIRGQGQGHRVLATGSKRPAR